MWSNGIRQSSNVQSLSTIFLRLVVVGPGVGGLLAFRRYNPIIYAFKQYVYYIIAMVVLCGNNRAYN